MCPSYDTHAKHSKYDPIPVWILQLESYSESNVVKNEAGIFL